MASIPSTPWGLALLLLLLPLWSHINDGMVGPSVVSVMPQLWSSRILGHVPRDHGGPSRAAFTASTVTVTPRVRGSLASLYGPRLPEASPERATSVLRSRFKISQHPSLQRFQCVHAQALALYGQTHLFAFYDKQGILWRYFDVGPSLRALLLVIP